MEIVIDINKLTYEEIKRYGLALSPRGEKELEKALKNGTSLPEHHGRLIDANSLIKAIEEKAKRLSNTDTINGLCGAVALIFDAPTIIEGSDSE